MPRKNTSRHEKSKGQQGAGRTYRKAKPAAQNIRKTLIDPTHVPPHISEKEVCTTGVRSTGSRRRAEIRRVPVSTNPTTGRHMAIRTTKSGENSAKRQQPQNLLTTKPLPPIPSGSALSHASQHVSKGPASSRVKPSKSLPARPKFNRQNAATTIFVLNSNS